MKWLLLLAALLGLALGLQITANVDNTRLSKREVLQGLCFLFYFRFELTMVEHGKLWLKLW